MTATAVRPPAVGLPAAASDSARVSHLGQMLNGWCPVSRGAQSSAWNAVSPSRHARAVASAPKASTASDFKNDAANGPQGRTSPQSDSLLSCIPSRYSGSTESRFAGTAQIGSRGHSEHRVHW